MARIRTIKPEFWDDEKLAREPREARLLFIGLLTFSDDYGIVKGNPEWLQGRIFPFDQDLTKIKFQKLLKGLADHNFIIPFDSNGENFYFIKNFLKHQKINRPSLTRNPAPPDSINTGNQELERRGLIEDSRRTHGALTAVVISSSDSDSSSDSKSDSNKEKTALFQDQLQTILERIGNLMTSRGDFKSLCDVITAAATDGVTNRGALIHVCESFIRQLESGAVIERPAGYLNAALRIENGKHNAADYVRKSERYKDYDRKSFHDRGNIRA
jgi:hypothetical protein